MTGDRWKAAWGFALLFVIASLAALLALAQVEEKTSYGLNIILGCLTTLSGAFAVWAFSAGEEDRKKDAQ